LWKHSVECGLAAKRVAKIAGCADPDEAFVGGILHDIGKVVILLNLPDEFRVIGKRKTTHKESSLEAEAAVLGFDHTMVGERLVEQWKMPPSLKACVRYHHALEQAAEFETLACIIACGDYFSHAQGAQPDEASAEHAIDLAVARRTLDLSDEQMQRLREQIDEDFQHSNVLD
jgi:putative nucleotidyltransferase with HDIG domain